MILLWKYFQRDQRRMGPGCVLSLITSRSLGPGFWLKAIWKMGWLTVLELPNSFPLLTLELLLMEWCTDMESSFTLHQRTSIKVNSIMVSQTAKANGPTSFSFHLRWLKVLVNNGILNQPRIFKYSLKMANSSTAIWMKFKSSQASVIVSTVARNSFSKGKKWLVVLTRRKMLPSQPKRLKLCTVTPVRNSTWNSIERSNLWQ